MKSHILLTISLAAGLLAGTSGVAAAKKPAKPSSLEIQLAVAGVSAYESGKDATALRQVEDLIRRSAGNKALRREVEVALAGLLAGNATFEAKRFACQQLAVIGTEAVFPAIAALLRSDETAGIACLALGSTASPKANETLRGVLAAATGMARIQIINTLGDRRDAEAVMPLMTLAFEADDATVAAAIIALGKIGTERAGQALTLLRKNPNPATVQAAVEGSLYVADRLANEGNAGQASEIYTELLAATQPPAVRRAAFEGLLRLDPAGAETRILQTLRGPDATLKPSAIAAVRGLKSKGVSGRLAQELPKLSAGEQALLITGLAARGDADARAALNRSLVSKEAVVRQAALAALAQQGDATAVPALVKALTEASSPEERQAAEEALIVLPGGKATDAAILTEFKQASPAGQVRIMPVLPRRGLHGAVPILIGLTANGTTAKGAFQALARLASAEDLPAVIDALVNLKVPQVRAEAETAAAQVLAKVNREAGAPDTERRAEAVCGALAKAKDVDTRVSLIGLLPACGGGRALETLQASAKDKEPRVSDAALRTLADWPDAAAWTPLLAVYRTTGNQSHHVLALRGLVRLAGEENAKPEPALLGRYQQLFDGAKTDDDRKMILGTLAGVAHPEALKLAVPLLANPALGAEAASAVKKIAEAIKAQHPQAAQEALEKLK